MDIDHSSEQSASALPAKNNNRAILIPRYDVVGSMGPGKAVPAGYVDVIEQVSINRDYLSALRVNFTNPDNLAIMTGWGGL